MAPSLRPSSLRPLLHTHRPSRPPPAPQPCRALHSRVTPAPVPSPTPFVPDAQTFLTLIGRSLSTHAAKIPSWPALFSLTSAQLRELGIEPARSRRYLLRWRAKFRRGEWGIGGDCAHVDAAGRAEVRVVDVPVGSDVERAGWRAVHGVHPAGDSVAARAEQQGQERGSGASLGKSRGMRRIVVNVPVEAAVGAASVPGTAGEEAAGEQAKDEAEAEAERASEDASEETSTTPAFKPLSPEQLAKSHPNVAGIKFRGAKGLVGSHVEPIKGTSGQAAIIRVKEGLWEDVRGHKVDGGERRKAEVRAKKRAAERKAGVR